MPTCLKCGEEFPDGQGADGLCSLECWKISRRRNGAGECEPKTCSECGEEFTPRHAKIRFCSEECRSIHNKGKDRERQKTRWRPRGYEVFLRDDFRCVYCGSSSVEDGVRLHADHIIPVSAGGDETMGNIVTACADCNRVKHDTRLSEDAEMRILELVKSRNERDKVSNRTIVLPFRSHPVSLV